MTVDNSTTTVSKLVGEAPIRKNKILIQLNSFHGQTNIGTKNIEIFSVGFLIEQDPKKSKSKTLSQGLKKKNKLKNKEI